jgi:hypothetical protein
METTTRGALRGRPIAQAVTSRGRVLDCAHTAGDARSLLANPSVTVIPVLDGDGYLGAVDASALGPDVPDSTPLARLARPLLPVAAASEPTEDALARLDEHGGLRLVVLDEDQRAYRGIVCLRSDRTRICIDAECHLPDALRDTELGASG